VSFNSNDVVYHGIYHGIWGFSMLFKFTSLVTYVIVSFYFWIALHCILHSLLNIPSGSFPVLGSYEKRCLENSYTSPFLGMFSFLLRKYLILAVRYGGIHYNPRTWEVKGGGS
jgi:hypothetical protein